MFRVFFSIGFLQAVTTIMSAVRMKVFAVLLGPGGVGVVATIDQLVVSVSQFFHLSLPKTALRFLSRDHSIGEEQFRKSYARFLQATIALSLAALAVILLLLPGWLSQLDPQLGQYRTPVSVALFAIPATMLQIFFVHVLAARQKPVLSILLTTISVAAFTVLGIIGCLVGGILGIYVAVVPVSTVLALALVIYARTKMNLPLRARPSGIERGMKTNPEIIETAVANYVAISCYSGFLLFARYWSITNLSEEAAGFLQAGLAIALSVGAILSPVSALYLAPNLNRVVPVNVKTESIDRFLPRLVLLYSLAALPLLLFPELTLRILFSGRFVEAADIVRVLLLWQCLFQIGTVYQQLLIGLDHVRAFALTTLAAYAVAGALCVWLIRNLGLTAIALAFTASALIIISSAALHLRLKRESVLPRPVASFSVFALLGLLGTLTIGNWTYESTAAGIVLRLSYAVLFVSGLWLLVPKAVRSELFEGAFARLIRASKPITPTDAF